MQNTSKSPSVAIVVRPPSHTIRFLKKVVLIAESNFEKSIVEKLINESENISLLTREMLVCQLKNLDMNTNFNR